MLDLRVLQRDRAWGRGLTGNSSGVFGTGERQHDVSPGTGYHLSSNMQVCIFMYTYVCYTYCYNYPYARPNNTSLFTVYFYTPEWVKL